MGSTAAGGGVGDAGRVGKGVDLLLDDGRFFAPYAQFFHATLGRPSIPIETYLRLMFLKHRYRLGFESLCREVTDSITWQRFCRIPLGGRVPHPTTLMKLTSRCGVAAVEGLNEALLANAVEAKVLKTNRVRADTTVVEANVAYPSDSGLLAKGVAKMAKCAKKLKSMGYATRTRLADKTRTARSRARSINANLKRRSDDRLDAVKRINIEMADIADKVAGQAEAVSAMLAVNSAASVSRPAVKHRAGRAPRAVTADRGYGDPGVEDNLRAVGVRYVVLPTRGKPNAARRKIEQRRAFKKMVRWRTGCEGRISSAKRDFGLSRSRMDGINGARTWCGHGIFAHNLVKISNLVA